MEKDTTLMKHILTDACHHFRPHYESSELLFEEKEDQKFINFGNKMTLILVLNGVGNFVKIQIDICHNHEDTVCGAQCKHVCIATIGLNSDCDIGEIREIFKTPTIDEQNIQDTENSLQSLIQECAKTEQVDESPKDKKKTTWGKRKKSSADIKLPKRAKKMEDTLSNIEQILANGFAIVGHEMDKFIVFTSERGKCNEMSNADMIKRNLMIINKNVCAIAQLFEQQKKWLD